MDKIMGVIFVIAVLALSGFVVAQGAKGVYFIESENGIVRAITGVRHNFDNGFTTELSGGQLRALEALGYHIEAVPLYHILGKPTCNYNTVCEPELGENPSCNDCKAGEETTTTISGTTTTIPGRACYPSAQSPWGVVMVNGGSGGAGINVAVLDTGVMTEHPDLDVKSCKDATKGPRIKDGCADSNGHGTHVAGTIAANGGADGEGIIGVAPEANLWVVKVCGASGSCWTDDMAAGIRYVADQGADIISMSIGGNTESDLVKDAIDYAVSKGTLVVAAAGNDGPSYGSIDYPAANVKVLAVGAIDSAEEVPDFSSRGINDGDYIIEEKEVEFGAPGVAVESTWSNGCYNTIEGTSMATPHVAGLAAKSWQGSASATRTYLQDRAKLHDLNGAGDDPATGFGLPTA